MERDAEFEERAVRYLLGELSGEERERLEARLLQDDETFDRLLATEDELLEAYARGELPSVQHALIAQRIATSPELERRLELIRGLVTVADEPQAATDEAPATSAVRFPASIPGRSGTWYWMSFSVVALVAAVATAWLFSANLDLRRRADELSIERDRLEQSQRRLQTLLEKEQERQGELVEELERQRREATALARRVGRVEEAQRRHPRTVSFVLTLGLRALSKPTGHPIPPGVDYVELQLDQEGDDRYDSFRAVIRNSRDQEVWSKDGLEAANLGWGRAVRLLIPAATLPQDRFEIILLGVNRQGELEDVGYYELNVLRPGTARD